jgi:hypothetical protein
MKNVLSALVAFLISVGPSVAYDAVYTPRKLSDDEFYSVAACNAPVGGSCRAPIVSWSRATARSLGIAVTVSGGASGDAASVAAIQTATARAIAEINRTGAGVQLSVVSKSRANIVLEIVTPAEMAKYVRRSGSSSVGDQGADGFSTIWWDNSRQIKKGEVKISLAVPDHGVNSVVLEEIFQALGFVTDVSGAPYNGVSILSESSNAVTTISGQDRMLLLRHYPR